MAYLPINSPKNPRSYLVNKWIWYNKFFMNQKHVYNINRNLEPNPSSISTKPCKGNPSNFSGRLVLAGIGTLEPTGHLLFFTWYGGNPWTVQKPLHGFLREFLRRFLMPFSGGNTPEPFILRFEPFWTVQRGGKNSQKPRKKPRKKPGQKNSPWKGLDRSGSLPVCHGLNQWPLTTCALP